MSHETQSDELRKGIRRLAAAYQAVKAYHDAQADTVFNANFEVMPCGRLDMPHGNPNNNLAAVIEHGLIVTVPNVPDDMLSPEAKMARTKAVEIGMNAANAVEPTRVSLLTKPVSQVSAGPTLAV